MIKKLLGILLLGLMFSFNVLAGEREVLESNETEAWKVDGKFIVPECLIYEWYSGDNYEVFYETYFQKDADHGDSNFRNFIENIGLFLNKEVPLNHSIKGWDSGPEEISLTKNVSDCVSKTPETYVTGLYAGTYEGYKVIKSIDIEEGKKLAPNIKEEFISIKLIERTNRPGSMGTRWHYNIYGIINLNGEKVIIPLKNEYNDKSIKKNLTFSSPSYSQSFEWIKNQKEYSDANELFWDKEKRFLKLIEKNIYADKTYPSFTGTAGTLFITIERLLGGPPTGIKYYDNRRYVTTSACEAHACPEKAFVFIDTKEKFVIGLIRKWDGEYYIMSKTHKTFDDLPNIFAQAVNDWESEVDVKPTEIFFIGADAELIKIK